MTTGWATAIGTGWAFCCRFAGLAIKIQRENHTFIPASQAEMALFTNKAYNDSTEKMAFVLLHKFTLKLITFIS